MAYIQPNSTIEFFGDLNLTDNYDDTLYFATEAEKDTYFTLLPKLATAPTCTYTRENRGYVRVEIPMSTLIGANYMRFKNTSFENKWWYAFVKKVDYINNLTTEVQFEIDPIMSWMGTFTLSECYIERQHTLHDGIGNNICEEGISVGDYIIQNHSKVTFEGPIKYFLVYLPYLVEPSTQEPYVDGQIIGGVYHGFRITAFNNDLDLDMALTELLQKNLIDNVVAIFSCYKEMADSYANTKTYTVSKPYTSLNGYVPRNKKLFCYPYNYLLIDNMQGDQHKYKYEYFNTLPDTTSSGDCDFEISWQIGGNCEIRMAPEDYRGESGRNLGERIGISNFPMGSWGTNTYEAYLAQKNSYLEHDIGTDITKVLGGAVSAAATGAAVGGAQGALLGGAVGAIGGIASSLLGNVAQNMVENNIHPVTPMEIKGEKTLSTVFRDFDLTFHVYQMCITKNYAMMLDSYFDMFGYAVKQHGIPNMNARPNWTYVKTIGCIVGGNIPADDASKIEDIFNRGVRFWKNHNNIGNYSLNNAPV